MVHGLCAFGMPHQHSSASPCLGVGSDSVGALCEAPDDGVSAARTCSQRPALIDSRQRRFESEPEVIRGSPPPGGTQVQGQASVEQADALAALVGVDGGCKHSRC